MKRKVMLTTEIEGVEAGVNFMAIGKAVFSAGNSVKEFMSFI